MYTLKKVAFTQSIFAHIAKCACLYYKAIQLIPRQYFQDAFTMKNGIQTWAFGLSWINYKRIERITFRLSIRTYGVCYCGLQLFPETWTCIKKCKNNKILFIIDKIYTFQKILWLYMLNLRFFYISYYPPSLNVLVVSTFKTCWTAFILR